MSIFSEMSEIFEVSKTVSPELWYFNGNDDFLFLISRCETFLNALKGKDEKE